MVVVSSRTFYRNQQHYIGLVNNGENVVMKSRWGSVHLAPTAEPNQDKADLELMELAEEGRKEYAEGKYKSFSSVKELFASL